MLQSRGCVRSFVEVTGTLLAIALVVSACDDAEPSATTAPSASALSPSALDLTEDTCKVTVREGTAEFRCPDGSGCLNLTAFDVRGTHCDDAGHCPVCPKDSTKPLKDSLSCPEGEAVCANFSHPVAYFCCKS